jgi:hypothetical protein
VGWTIDQLRCRPRGRHAASSGLRSEHCPEGADIPDRREPRPIDYDAADACEREEEDDDGDQHANASQDHAPYASRGPGQRLTAAAVWVNDGNWRPARAVVRRKPSFGLAFPGDRRTDDDFRLLSLFGQACPTRGDASLPRLARAPFPRPSDRGILGLHAAQLWSAILRDLRQRISRIGPSPACLPRSSPRTSRLSLGPLSTS